MPDIPDTPATSDVLVIAHYSGDDETSNNRFNDLANRLSAGGYAVELVTSSYSHQQKRQRSWDYGMHKYRRTLIHEPGYSRNVSLRRLYSHRTMARNLRKYLALRPKPDLIYCAIPSLAISAEVARYCTSKGTPLIIDIQDLWPEAFKFVLPAMRLTSLMLSPMRKSADYIYRSATAVVAVSQTYADRALSVRSTTVPVEVIYLGTDLARFDQYTRRPPSQGVSREDEIRVVYIGTHGHSYDLPLLCDALALASLKSTVKFRLITMGHGPKFEEYRRYAIARGLVADFLGELPYPEMVANLAHCHIAVNPIREGSAGSVINKVADYAAAALPVLNTQESQEYRQLVERWDAGRNVTSGDSHELADQIVVLAENEELRSRLGRGNRRLAHSQFDRRHTYPRIVALVDRVVTNL